MSFDDASWEKVNIPHDWAIKGPFDENGDGGTGKLPWQGEGWYRKTFDLKAEDQGKVFYIKFDGIMSSPNIYINGKLAGAWGYGYSTFYLDISNFVNPGEKNTVAVYADTRNHGSRWYPGAGMYRKVEMMVTSKVHKEIWGTYITTPVVKLTPDRSNIKATGDDLSYILVEAYDKDGNLCPLADNLINFEIKGPGEIAAVENGNPQSLEPYVVNYRKLFYGKAMLILRSKENKAGKIDVVATSNGLIAAKISVAAN